MEITVKVLCIFAFVVISSQCFGLDISASPDGARNNIKAIVIELLVVFDFEQSRVFQFNKTLAVEYLKAVLYETYINFKTLDGIHVDIDLNGVYFMKSLEEQLSLEKPEPDIFSQTLLPKFGKWMHKRWKSFPQFDIAMYAFADTKNSEMYASGTGSWAGACRVGDRFAETQIGAFVVNFGTGIIPLIITHEIGHLLGSLHDEPNTYNKFGCGKYTESEGRFVMNASAGHEHKHFSPCSSKQIWRFLGTSNSHCLTKLHQTGIKLFSTRALKLGQKEMSEFKGMSMDEQCKIFVNDTVAVSRTSEIRDACFKTMCVARECNNPEKEHYRPFEGTPCMGEERQCWRQKCRPQGIYLRNHGSKLCVASGIDASGFQWNSPKLKPCSEISVTPLEAITLYKNSSELLAITVMDSFTDKLENSLFCLTVDKPTGRARFSKCHETESFEWELKNEEQLLGHNTKNFEFLLFHQPTGSCLQIDNTRKYLFASSSCLLLQTQWNFLLGNGTLLTNKKLQAFIEDVSVHDGIYLFNMGYSLSSLISIFQHFLLGILIVFLKRQNVSLKLSSSRK